MERVLLNKAQDMRWIFVSDGESAPFVITFNSFSWPREMTLSEKMQLESKPTKSKVILLLGNQRMVCSLAAVVKKKDLETALEYINEKNTKELSKVNVSGILLPSQKDYAMFYWKVFSIIVLVAVCFLFFSLCKN